MQDLSLMERFADPALFVNLTFAEKLEGGLVTTLMGLGTTFVVLTLIWGVIAFMARIINKAGKSGKPEAPETAAAPAAAPPAAPPEARATTVNASMDLIAVLMGSIAAYEGTAALNNLYIRRISRVSGSRPAWGNAGTADSIDSRKF